MSDIFSTAGYSNTSALSTDDYKKIIQEMEKFFSLPRPELVFDKIWSSAIARDKILEELNAEISPQETGLSMLCGIRLIEFPMPDDQAWLIQSPSSPFKLPQIVRIINIV